MDDVFVPQAQLVINSIGGGHYLLEGVQQIDASNLEIHWWDTLTKRIGSISCKINLKLSSPDYRKKREIARQERVRISRINDHFFEKV